MLLTTPPNKQDIAIIISLLTELNEIILAENNQLDSLDYNNVEDSSERKIQLLSQIEHYREDIKNLKADDQYQEEYNNIANLIKILDQQIIQNKRLIEIAIAVNNKLLSNISKAAKKRIISESAYEEKGFYSSADKQIMAPFAVVNYNV